MPTLRDVARRAGVSAMTVSNVINGREGKVSARTVARVEAAVKDLGYIPNASARALAAASSRIIALVYEAVPGRNALEAPYESLFVGTCEQAAREAGFALMLCGASRPEETVSQLRSWNVAGAVVMATTRMAPREFLQRSGVPAVFVDSYDEDPDICRVNVDDVGGARLAGQAVGRAGHRHVVFAGPSVDRRGVVRERLRGFREALEPFDVSVGRQDVVLAEVSFADGHAVARRLLNRSRPVTAVFASGDVLALGIVAGLRTAGRRVPDDVSVVGFDGLDMASYVEPPLTTVHQSVQDKAATAVAYLISTIQGGDAAPDLLPGQPPAPLRTVLPVTWWDGGTLGPAAPPQGGGR